MIRILFVAANPVDTDPLQLGEEFREIQSKLRVSDNRSYFMLRSAWAARPDDLLQQMNEFRPHIVHFSGHGSGAGEIVLQDSSGKMQAVSPAVLKVLFGNFREWLRIVVLNACYSNVQAEALLDSADIVIGMNSAIGDKAAISFASAFYRALGFDRTVQDAFNQGLISLQLEKIPEGHIPTLLHRPGINPDRLTITDPGNRAAASQRIDDPLTPENIRKLLQQGTEMILLDEEDDSPTDKANRLLIELGMRQSSAVFIVEVNRRLPTGRVAPRLAQYLIPDLDIDEYEWALVKEDKSLPVEHTLMMAGVRSGDQVKLVGNHRRPIWAPALCDRVVPTALPSGLEGWLELPKEGGQVGGRIEVRGHVDDWRHDCKLWIAHRREPRGAFWLKPPEIQLDDHGNFSVSVFEGGLGGRVVISLLAVPVSRSQDFEKWLQNGEATGHYPGIYPTSADRELDNVIVSYNPDA
jgi:hypothetical protein